MMRPFQRVDLASGKGAAMLAAFDMGGAPALVSLIHAETIRLNLSLEEHTSMINDLLFYAHEAHTRENRFINRLAECFQTQTYPLMVHR